SFVNSRNSLKPKSRRVLELELKKLGVTQTDIDVFFSKNPTDEIALAQKALKKKVKSLLFITDQKKRFIKAISFLQRRGFSYDVSRETYNSCFSIEK
ncbi:MAG: RecX family transcriptional regulator, partial [Candidatus Roizmanbacteria bacterium]|nr:RecX family transcriptional regulator [Candidatus Roizmanbacteria bacterium]